MSRDHFSENLKYNYNILVMDLRKKKSGNNIFSYKFMSNISNTSPLE